MKLESLGSILTLITNPIGDLADDAVVAIADHFRKELAALPGMIAGSISAAISGIAGAFTGAIHNFLRGGAPIGDPGGVISPIPQNYHGDGVGGIIEGELVPEDLAGTDQICQPDQP